MKFFPDIFADVSVLKQKAKTQSLASAVAAPILLEGAKTEFPAWQVAGVGTVVGYAVSYAVSHFSKKPTTPAPSLTTISASFTTNLAIVKGYRLVQ